MDATQPSVDILQAEIQKMNIQTQYTPIMATSSFARFTSLCLNGNAVPGILMCLSQDRPWKTDRKTRLHVAQGHVDDENWAGFHLAEVFSSLGEALFKRNLPLAYESILKKAQEEASLSLNSQNELWAKACQQNLSHWLSLKPKLRDEVR